LTVPAGLWLWNGQGRQFGLGTAGDVVDRVAVLEILVVFVVLVAIGFWVGE
jgi:hypothetical protein